MASLDKFCKSVKVKPMGGRLLVPPKPKPPLPRPRPPRPPLPPPPRDIPTKRRAWIEEDFLKRGLSQWKVINNGRNRSVMDLNLRRPNKREMICTSVTFFLPPTQSSWGPDPDRRRRSVRNGRDRDYDGRTNRSTNGHDGRRNRRGERLPRTGDRPRKTQQELDDELDAFLRPGTVA